VSIFFRSLFYSHPRMQTTDAVERILANYAGENAGIIGHLRRMLLTGRLAGTGKMVILPVDQGFEHGPARSFQPNPAGYDPRYHAQLAVDAGCNAYAAPLGFMEVIAAEYAGRLPLILKVNSSDSLGGPSAPCSALTSGVPDAVRLGCSAVGYTIYPASDLRNEQLQDLRDLVREARAAGLPTVVWSYPRGSISAKGETAVDVVAYAAHIACQMGAHIVKVKPPADYIELEAAKKTYAGVDTSTLEKRVAHVVQAAFGGKRIVIFSGGAAKDTAEVLDEIRGLAKGGAFGSIMGRNSFQRPHKEAVELLQQVMDIYAKEAKA
jgi:class I fructose-bisphosphate aldolase